MDRPRDPSNEPSVGVPPTQTFGVSIPSDESAAFDTTATNRPSGGTPTPFIPAVPHYPTIRFVGEGGMGQVFLVHDVKHNRDVALKFLRFGADTPQPLVDRFNRETEILKKLDHPNVVRVYDSGEWMGFPFYVMRYVTGGSLVRQCGVIRTSARRVAEFLAKVAEAVHYVHDRGVFHRDLKPGNILVDEKGEPLLVDFGIAKYDDGHTTTGVALLGTPAYMAPELIVQGPQASSAVSDVWALGVILYELLTGERPFPGNRYEPELFERIKSQAPPPFDTISDTLPDADARLETVCLKCLAKDPARRYQTAAELAIDLTRWLNGESTTEVNAPEARLAAGVTEPTTVIATTVTHDERRTRRRWPVAVGLLVVLVAAGIAASAIPWWKWKTDPTTEGGQVDSLRKQTLAERMPNVGDSIEFIGESGLPEKKDHNGPLRGFVGTMTEGFEGRCTLTTAKLYFHEVFNEVLSFPVRWEVEVAIDTPESPTIAGLYALEKTHTRQSGKPVHVGYINCFGMGDRDPVNRRKQLNNLAVASVGKFSVPDGTIESNSYTMLVPLFPDTWKKIVPADQIDAHDRPIHFHRLAIELRADGLTGERDGVTSGRFDRIGPNLIPLNGLLNVNGVVLNPPTLGAGFGLFVRDGGAQFRHLRITRLAESQPTNSK
jgi:Protein kinase domain